MFVAHECGRSHARVISFLVSSRQLTRSLVHPGTTFQNSTTSYPPPVPCTCLGQAHQHQFPVSADLKKKLRSREKLHARTPPILSGTKSTRVIMMQTLDMLADSTVYSQTATDYPAGSVCGRHVPAVNPVLSLLHQGAANLSPLSPGSSSWGVQQNPSGLMHVSVVHNARRTCTHVSILLC